MARSLPARPQQVVVGAWLLAVGAAALGLSWLVGLDVVESNGARVFFVVVWGYLAWVVRSGGGWARWAIVAIWIVTVWGLVNAPTLDAALAALTPGEVAAKSIALVAFCLLMHPASKRWFATVRQMEADTRGAAPAPD